MKQILSLALALLPCLAWAQYPSNGNQKITLGEQTTADGLIWRGVAADTTLTAKSDTAAYFVLDTVNINLYTYKASATGRKWRQLGADTAAISYVNTYGTQTVNGEKTFTSDVKGARFNPTNPTATGTGMFAPTSTSLGFSTNGTNKMTLNDSGNLLVGTTTDAGFKLTVGTGGKIAAYRSDNNRRGLFYTDADATWLESDITGNDPLSLKSPGSNGVILFYTSTTEKVRITSGGNVGIGTASPAVQFHTTSNVRFAGLVNYDPVETDADGDIIDGGASDFNLKNSIEPINYGLNSINQLKPVSYLWNDVNRKLDSTIPDIGFIAQDVMDVIPEAVRSNGDGHLQLNYKAITATLVKAIQEQNSLIKALEQRIINLENK